MGLLDLNRKFVYEELHLFYFFLGKLEFFHLVFRKEDCSEND